ncbi:hypothetical protein [Coleofasciculus sp.]|uniref:hypothetical protein n=1 Tax=Coleofasciculus sp. TaxID=3100458 RepID=UPI0039F8B470
MGRELIALYTFGYRRINHSQEKVLGLCFAPCNRNQAMQANFGKICTEVEKFKSSQQIKDLLEYQMNQYDNYDYAAFNPKIMFRFEVIETIPAYEEAMIESIHCIYEINNGMLLLCQSPENRKGNYLKVRTNSRITKKMTGFRTETLDNVQMFLMVHQDIIFQSSLVRRKY